MPAIVPPPLTEDEYWHRRHEEQRLRMWVRGALLALVLIPLTVFAVAFYLNPYRDGRLWLEETHTQLGLPPCTFKVVTGLPCPSCGMTTSFALFVRGDLLHSLEANAAGTLLALVAFLFVPWALASALYGRLVLVRRWETWLTRVVLAFTGLMFLRWGTLLLLRYFDAAG